MGNRTDRSGRAEPLPFLMFMAGCLLIGLWRADRAKARPARRRAPPTGVRRGTAASPARTAGAFAFGIVLALAAVVVVYLVTVGPR